MQQLSGVGWTPKLISLLVAVTEPSFQAQLPGVSNNVTGPSQWERSVVFTPAIASAAGFEWDGPSGAEFTSLYGNMTSAATPTYHSAEAAAAIFVLAHAIQAANSLNTTQVRAELGSMKLMTFFGKFQVNSAGLQVAHEMIGDQWQAAAPKALWPAAVAGSPLPYPYPGGRPRPRGRHGRGRGPPAG